MRAAFAAPLALALAGALSSCVDPDVFVSPVAGGPAGALNGTLTYVGPPPCTANGHVVGSGVLLVFDVRALPPPEGLGTTAASLGVVSGDELFAGIADRLVIEPSGALWCPDVDAPDVTVSADWSIAPLTGGVYEIRGFYDLDGDFDPTFGISNLPTGGDVAGGALDNAAAAANGAQPIYRQIALGDLQPDGSRVIPDDGARVGGVAVSFGLRLPYERPVFHVQGVFDPTNKNPDLAAPSISSDFQIDTFDPAQMDATQDSFVRLTLGAGVAPEEVADAVKSPFFLPGDDAKLVYTRFDANGDGKIDSQDHVPQSTLLPALGPLAVFTKLSDDSLTVNQSSPTVVLQGLTLYKSLLETATTPTDFVSLEDAVLVAVPPAVLCIDTNAPDEPAVLVVSHQADTHGNALLADEDGVKASLAAQFGRPVDIVYACLPEGTFAMNLVYSTGQAWTMPNEAGVCAASEAETATTCGARPKLVSQRTTFAITAPTSRYCDDHPVPAACLPKP